MAVPGHQSRIDAILGEWRARRDAGESVSPEEVIAAHPELAESLIPVRFVPMTGRAQERGPRSRAP